MIPILEKPESRLETEIKERREPVNLTGPVKSIRPELYRPNSKKAMFSAIVGIVFHSFSLGLLYFLIKNDYTYLLPLGWLLAGTSVTSLFVLGHDCAHASFLKNNRINDVLGHFFFLFSFYPYYGWKFSHNAHHAHTNNLDSNNHDVYYDNAWLPFTVSQYLLLRKKKPVRAAIYRWTRYLPPLGSLLHNIINHAYPSKYIETHRKKLYLSYVVLGLGVVCLFLAAYLFTGKLSSIFHFFIAPGIVFQFWMSYYTYLHHTSDEIYFYKQEDWNPYKGQIHSTYNFLNPKIISFLHFHIDIHTPHHLSTAIPCYHLKEAYRELKKSEYANDVKEGKFSLSYIYRQWKQCHVWDEKENKYKSFREVHT
ncbi:fatty acid desaturase [Leptospira sp. 'Mane']|uniref:fatty acid desaturase n=1 Tax=Leptospira sp. 'Mane' TaxID=3387407 RepID=UPI00398B4E57